MGSRQVSNQAVAEESLGHHLESTSKQLSVVTKHQLTLGLFTCYRTASILFLPGSQSYRKRTETAQSIVHEREAESRCAREEADVRARRCRRSLVDGFASSGSLLTRSLNDLVKKEQFVLNSEYLKTLLVCVPKALINDWHAKYETICPMIVPRTTELITQDQDYALFTVTLFQKTEDTFRYKCRENKCVVSRARRRRSTRCRLDSPCGNSPSTRKR